MPGASEGPAVLLVLLVAAAVACGRKETPAPIPSVDPAVSLAPALSAPESAAAPVAPAGVYAPPRPRLHLTLRSTPAGAAAAVDGRPVGTTPVFLETEADGRPHEFAFILPGYAPWRAKFPTIRDGVVQATLKPVDRDAGTP